MGRIPARLQLDQQQLGWSVCRRAIRPQPVPRCQVRRNPSLDGNRGPPPFPAGRRALDLFAKIHLDCPNRLGLLDCRMGIHILRLWPSDPWARVPHCPARHFSLTSRQSQDPRPHGDPSSPGSR